MEESQTSEFKETNLLMCFFYFCFSVQDFLDKAKKDFEENWSKNPKVSFSLEKNTFQLSGDGNNNQSKIKKKNCLIFWVEFVFIFFLVWFLKFDFILI